MLLRSVQHMDNQKFKSVLPIVLSGRNQTAEHVNRYLLTHPRSEQGKELDKRLSDGKAKFEVLSNEIESKINTLFATPDSNLPSIMPAEKCMKERYIEALISGCSTAKEACIRLNPGMHLYTPEKKRRLMMATSMFLLRLSNSSERLVERSEESPFHYYATARSLPRSWHYISKRAKIDYNKRLKVKMEEILRLSEETITAIVQMATDNAEAAKKLGNSLAENMHYLHRGDVEGLMRESLELQRALIKDCDEIPVQAHVQGTRSLLQMGRREANLSTALELALEEQKSALEEQKRMEDFQRQLNLDLQMARELTAERPSPPSQRSRAPSSAQQKAYLTFFRELKRRSTQIQVHRGPTPIQIYNRPAQIELYKPPGTF